MNLSRETTVGVFTIVVTGILFWASFYIGKMDTTFGKGRTLSAMLDNAHQLGVDSVVEVAGIHVGRITGLEIVRGGKKALIHIKLSEEVIIYRDAEVSVLTTGFLGDRYVNLIPGTEESGILPDNETIVNTRVPIAFEEMMASLTPLIEDAVGMLAEMRALISREEIRDGIPETIDSLRHTALSMELVFADYEKYVSKFLRNAAVGAEYLSDKLPKLIDTLSDEIGGSGEMFGNLSSAVTGSVSKFDRLTTNLDEITKNLNNLLSDLNNGEGAFGALLKDEETAMEVKEAVASLNQTLGSINKLQTVVQYLGTYEPDLNSSDTQWRHRTEILIKPSYDHHYSVGIVDRTGSDDLLFNAQIAKRFYDITLRGGILENKGGAGVDFAFWKDRIWLQSEVFDFSRKNDRPRVRSWAELRLLKHLRIVAGATDLAGKSGPRGMFGAGITFSDDDIRTMFGLARTASSF